MLMLIEAAVALAAAVLKRRCCVCLRYFAAVADACRLFRRRRRSG